ncbi:MAG: hypothetical protein K6E64_01710 [Lachnospiraceae bacterium]|nr:hypothetical protein [Lachnospiraceae bacterium]
MKTYEKPVVILNKELCEGVYMASGAQEEASSVEAAKAIVANWGGGNGQATFTFATGVSGRAKIEMTFTEDITNAWGNGYEIQKATSKSFSCETNASTVVVYVQTNKVEDIQVKSITCTAV